MRSEGADPFARGYTTRSWEVDDACQPIDISGSPWSAPMLADFLDALRCGGLETVTIEAAIEPDTDDPYPTDEEPLCE